jgi:presenilin-like A22 family membrane protease
VHSTSVISLNLIAAAAAVTALNADFMPAISVGDCGCLVAGGAIPYLLARSVLKDRRHPYLPAIIGAIVGFVINVVIL